MAIVAIVLLLAGVILAIAALAVRFAGNTAVLSGIDSAGVKDMAALNRWAGNRLFVLPAAAFAFGVAGLNHPSVSIIGVGVLLILGIAVIVSLMVGSDRFRVAS